MPVMPFTRSPEDPLEALATTLVGRVDLDRTRSRVCRAMLREALRRTGGNYTHAAVLLGVKRQAVQQMVRRLELEVWATALKGERVAVGKAARPKVSKERAVRGEMSDQGMAALATLPGVPRTEPFVEH